MEVGMGFTEFFIYLWLYAILHPIKIYRILRHSEKNNHAFNMHVVNFNYDIWCDDCGEVWSDEIK